MLGEGRLRGLCAQAPFRPRRMRAFRSRRRPSPYPLFTIPFSPITQQGAQPEIRGAAHMQFYTLLWHIASPREAFSSRKASRPPFQGTQWHITPLCEFRVAAIRLFVGGEPSLFAEVRAFRHDHTLIPDVHCSSVQTRNFAGEPKKCQKNLGFLVFFNRGGDFCTLFERS